MTTVTVFTDACYSVLAGFTKYPSYLHLSNKHNHGHLVQRVVCTGRLIDQKTITMATMKRTLYQIPLDFASVCHYNIFHNGGELETNNVLFHVEFYSFTALGASRVMGN